MDFILKILLTSLLVIQISSCSYFEKATKWIGFGKSNCNQNSAFLDGARQAGRMLPSSPLKSAEKCGTMDDYTPQSYIYDYEKGYNARIQEQCSPQRARMLGRYAAQRQDLSEHELMRYKVCENIGMDFEMLRQEYLYEFGKIYCSEDKAKELAKHASSRLKKMDKDFLRQCRGAAKFKLERAYERSYNMGIARTCSKDAIAKKAMADVRLGLSLKEGIKTVNLCRRKNRKKFRKIYEDNFRFELGRIERLAIISNLQQAERQILLEESKVDYRSGNFDLYTLCEVSNNKTKGILLPVQLEDLTYKGAFEVRYYSRPDFRKISNSENVQSYQNKLIKRVIIPETSFNISVDGVIIVNESAPRRADLCKVYPR